MNYLELKTRLEEIPFWYHRIQLPHGLQTSGINPLNVEAYQIPEDLAGKRVLDVGAWDGFWTFEALQRGAAEVVAIDDFSDFLGQSALERRRNWKSFDLCREALGYDHQRGQRYELSIYDLDPKKLGGTFDIVFFFGTLYHLRHPLLGLDRLSSVCHGEIFVESQICDDYSAYRGLGQGYPGRQMVAEFFPTQELADNPTNWWSPNLYCLAGWLYAAGFSRDIRVWKLLDQPSHLGHCRGFAHAAKPKFTGG